MSLTMNWKDYEKEVHQYFSQLYPDAKITYDAKIIGRYSKKERQIDVLIEDEIAGFPIKIAVDAKNFSKKIDVKCVESFISMIEDAEANQGLMVTQKGYSDAAINRAHYGPHKLDLDVLNFDDLLNNQGPFALPYSGENAIELQAPFGWIVDNSKQQAGCIACLYQRGLNLKSAQKNLEWMYCNFWHKKEDVSSIAALVEMQNEGMKADYTNLCISERHSPKRNDGRDTYIRAATSDQLPCIEITGYIDCGEFIFFFVMFTKKELESRNFRKLAYVIKYSTPAKIKFDNTRAIEQLENRCGTIEDAIEKHVPIVS